MGSPAVKMTVPRAVQTKNTKNSIIKAAAEILKKKGYAYLTVSNICSVAGISNGTFFYHFKTKEELLTYYVDENFSKFCYANGFEAAMEGLSIPERIIKFYCYWSDYMVFMGLDFCSNFYSTNNYSLDLRLRDNLSPGNISRYPGDCVAEAHHLGLLKKGIGVSHCKEVLVTIIKGIAFDWCLSKGAFDMHVRLHEIMGPYLESVFV